MTTRLLHPPTSYPVPLTTIELVSQMSAGGWAHVRDIISLGYSWSTLLGLRRLGLVNLDLPDHVRLAAEVVS